MNRLLLPLILMLTAAAALPKVPLPGSPTPKIPTLKI